MSRKERAEDNKKAAGAVIALYLLRTSMVYISRLVKIPWKNPKCVRISHQNTNSSTSSAVISSISIEFVLREMRATAFAGSLCQLPLQSPIPRVGEHRLLADVLLYSMLLEIYFSPYSVDDTSLKWAGQSEPLS